MNEAPYTTREIDAHFETVNNKIADLKDILLEIKDQTTKTNGRVNKLENWRSYLAGAVAVLVLVVLPALGYLAEQVIKLSASVSIVSASSK